MFLNIFVIILFHYLTCLRWYVVLRSTDKMKGKQGKQKLSDNQVLGDYDSTSNAEWHAPGGKS